MKQPSVLLLLQAVATSVLIGVAASAHAGPLDGFAPVQYGTGFGDGTGYRTLYRFKGNLDGASPSAPLTRIASGRFVGTTISGGQNSGTAYELTRSGRRYHEKVLYRFSGGADGLFPTSSLVTGAGGVLYGTTLYGGRGGCQAGCGTVYELLPSGSGYAERVIYAFQNGSDGAFPAPTLAFLNGALYGATFGGGLYRCRGLYGGSGTVFALTPSGSGYTESILYRFRGGNDGAEPGIVFVSGNVLYGTTVSGFHKHGTVFELLLSKGTARKRLVHGFEGGQDGAMPTGLLKRGGALYGTTFEGGGYSGCFLSYLGCGTVFELARSGDAFTETILHRFSGPDGGNPNTGLIAGNNGVLYGTTQWGGTTCPQGCGTVSNLCRHKTVTSLRRCTYSMHQPLTCRPG